MLFNSPIFVFAFVPIVLIGFFLIARAGARPALIWLTVASIFFYGWWNPLWVPLLLASIAFNFVAGREIAIKVTGIGESSVPRVTAKTILVVAVAANLGLLTYFKYAAFFFNNIAAVLGLDAHLEPRELPLGISFFTFTQIAFLVDAFQRKANDFDRVRYGLFVTYFPHLIAGPILHHKEMMPQFAKPDVFSFDPKYLADGVSIFILGLFKKTVLADQFGIYAGVGFSAPDGALSFFASWGAALSYTLQLYFDFSGYSDMAIGLALMIGVRLPTNFHSPYKALNITEFWRRWHMTLSRFLRDYLYIPLGGNRKGATRRYVNLMVTMLLGGLWHGAGWTFVLWGALHGALLVAHNAWSYVRQRLGLGAAAGFLRLPATCLAWTLTFTAVVVGWVFFRSADLSAAWSMLRGMAGLNGAFLPDQLLAIAPWLGRFANGAGTVPFLADGTVMGFIEMVIMIVIGMVLVLFTPAMHELRSWARYALIVPCAALAIQRVLFGGLSEFLYFQF